MRDTAVIRLGWVAILLGLASMLAASAFGYRQGWWPVLRAIDVATWGAWAAIAGAALALVALGLWLARRRGGGGIAALGLMLSLPILIAAGAWQYATLTTPPINDISTDTDDPPVFWFTATPSDYPAQNAEPQHAAYPYVARWSCRSRRATPSPRRLRWWRTAAGRCCRPIPLKVRSKPSPGAAFSASRTRWRSG